MVDSVVPARSGSSAGTGRVSIGALARSCYLESRPVVLLMFLTRFVVVVAMLGPGDGRWPAVVCAGLAWMLAVVAVYLGNGLCDLVEDRANGRGRPLASGALRPEHARAVVVAAAVASVALAGFASPTVSVLAVAFLGLGYAYSAAGPPRWRPWKATAFGTSVTGVLGMMLTYAAAWVVTGRPVTPTLVVFAVLLGLWTGVVGTCKDLADAPGDEIAGRRTLAVVLGAGRARRAVAWSAGTLAAVAVTAATVVPHLWPTACCLAVGAATLVVHLLATDRGGRPYKLFMGAQWAAHVVALVS